VQEYIKNTLSDPQKVVEIQSFLQQHLLIQGLVRIPIQLDALCFTWGDSFSNNPILQTMTAIYQTIEHRLWQKDVLRLGKTHDRERVTETLIQLVSRAMLEGFVKDEISLLEGLAFTGLHNDVIDFNSEHRNAVADCFTPSLLVDKTLPRLSFLRTSDSSLQNSLTTYHFLHLTYQEYFAARYFVRQWMSGQDLKCLELNTRETQRGRPVNHPPKRCTTVSYLQKYKYNARYDIFWRFVTGLLQAKGGDTQLCPFFRMIEEKRRDLLGPVHQRLVMHCLSEVAPLQETLEFKQLREDREHRLKEWLLFECNFAFNGGRRS
jgi:hypothetical protein